MGLVSTAAKGGGGGSGTISDITSNDNTVTITDPMGPTTDLSAASAGGTVSSVTSANTSIAVATGTTTPVLTVGTADKLFTNNAPIAAVALNAQKITGLANGSGAQDGAAFGQIPTALPPNGSAGGDLSDTYPNPKVAKITETSGPTDLTIGTITDGQFLKRSGSTLISAAGGTGTVTSVASGDTSIVVSNATTTPSLQMASMDTQFTNNAPAGSLAMNSHKLTGLAAGSGAGDSLRYEQAIGSNVLAVSNLVAGTAGQVLGGTGPSYALPPGYEINYTAITSDVSIASSTEASGTSIFAPGALTFDGGAVIVEVFCGLQGGTAGNIITLCLFEASTEITDLCIVIFNVAGTGNLIPVCARYRFTPSAGAHTYTVTAFANATSGTQAKVKASAAGTASGPPAYIRFTKV